ncbi:MAG: hypothetical protein QUS33_04070, partial [Dehalococcoidia bacterium]|nr:hypothetical protein [Dehalococcoidia bacterium]
MRISVRALGGAGFTLVVAYMCFGCRVWADSSRYIAQDLAIATDPKGREDTYVAPFDSDKRDVSATMADGRVKAVPTELVITCYTGKLVDMNNPGAPSKSQAWLLYQLRSTDKGLEYSWYTWSRAVLGRFKLFTLSNGCTYLSWVQFGTVAFTDVSAPVKPELVSSKLEELLNDRQTNIHYVPVSQLLNRDLFIDSKTTGHYGSIYVTSIRK